MKRIYLLIFSLVISLTSFSAAAVTFPRTNVWHSAHKDTCSFSLITPQPTVACLAAMTSSTSCGGSYRCAGVQYTDNARLRVGAYSCPANSTMTGVSCSPNAGFSSLYSGTYDAATSTYSGGSWSVVAAGSECAAGSTYNATTGICSSAPPPPVNSVNDIGCPSGQQSISGVCAVPSLAVCTAANLKFSSGYCYANVNLPTVKATTDCAAGSLFMIGSTTGCQKPELSKSPTSIILPRLTVSAPKLVVNPQEKYATKATKTDTSISSDFCAFEIDASGYMSINQSSPNCAGVTPTVFADPITPFKSSTVTYPDGQKVTVKSAPNMPTTVSTETPSTSTSTSSSMPTTRIDSTSFGSSGAITGSSSLIYSGVGENMSTTPIQQVTTSGTNSGSGTGEDLGSGENVELPTYGFLPDLPTSFYESSYPEGFSSVWNEAKSSLDNSSFASVLDALTPNVAAGTCPSWSLDFNMGVVNLGEMTLQPPCYIWDILKVIFIVTSLFVARSLVFGG